MTRVAVATTSRLAARAAETTAALGGNAVDCALAASLLTMNAEPGVCALAGGAYISISKPGEPPVTFDGNVAVPGHGASAKSIGGGVDTVSIPYGGGITTLVGVGSVGVPGSLAALEAAWKRFGRVRWPDLFEPSIQAARDGFPLSRAANFYLAYAGKLIYGRSDDGYRALHDGDVLRSPGSRVFVPHLEDSLSLIAAEGAKAFYTGDLAVAISRHCKDGGGVLGMEDLRRYRSIERPALQVKLDDWLIATNPTPAVGGVVLGAMLSAFSRTKTSSWNAEAVGRLVAVQRACLGFRRQYLDLSDDIGADAALLLEEARSGRLVSQYVSASTVHTSAVDEDGLACAITASSGYGSGEMPEKTGLWLNNCIGELELNRRGLDAGPVGARLPSNMAPSIARKGGHVIAIGSPGADRITTAIHQFMVNALQMGMPLSEAVAHPRIHLDTSGENDRLMAEAGLPLPELDLPVMRFEEIGMYFGGVGAASFDVESGFDVAADPRREGGTFVPP